MKWLLVGAYNHGIAMAHCQSHDVAFPLDVSGDAAWARSDLVLGARCSCTMRCGQSIEDVPCDMVISTMIRDGRLPRADHGGNAHRGPGKL